MFFFQDALYYDVILVDLRKDAKRQGKCMLQSTQLGQLAMEYLDDRRDEYKLLEMMVKVDMNQRLTDLDVVSKQLNFIQDNMKTLIRRDVSSFNPPHSGPKSKSGQNMKKLNAHLIWLLFCKLLKFQY